MSFFDSPSKTVIKPKVIRTTVTKVVQKPKPAEASSRLGYDRERFEPYRRDTPESSSGGSASKASGSKRRVEDRRVDHRRVTPVKKVKKEKVVKRKMESSSEESSSSSDEEGEGGGVIGTNGFQDEDGPVWANMPERRLFNSSGVEREWEGMIESKEVVRRNIGNYHTYFPQEGFGIDGPLSEVELLYPASGCKEKFLLLAPPNDHEYSPIGDLMRTIYALVKTYVPSSHSQIFGHTPDDHRLSLLQSSSLAHIPDSGHSSPLPGTPPATASTTNIPILEQSTEEPIIRSLQKSINRKDGPAFLLALNRFNATIASLQSSGALQAHLDAKSGVILRSEWESLVAIVGEQVYQRVVGPETSKLKDYVAFSDNVYGELLPRFVTEIINRYKMGPKSVFVDLGSGVGNCLIQVALQSGSSSYGAEQLPNPSELAILQIAEAKRRWSMWRMNGHPICKAYEGDFCESAEVGKRLKTADVVLINNYAFTAPLNERISYLFLELKEGAVVISLKPFLPRDFRITERSAGSALSILRMKEHTYPANSVSWTHEGGKFYEHVIDRKGLLRFAKKEVGSRRAARDD